ncbi:MAG: hypothetical protein HXY40_01195 [Chloroflexi bacterium]|nr:hypothetical protein [Chloroflexota bacterium]
MTAEVLGDREIEAFVRTWQMIPASGGKFEVTVNGEVLFSKKALGRHAKPGEIKTAINKKLQGLRQQLKVD